jgi:AcrR family transcriptional regulator
MCAASQTRPPRTPRRDTERIQAQVLAAAREVLGEAGPEASMERIAARAGVGVGTVYRRFPGKESLVEQLVTLVTEELVEAGDRALTDDRGDGLERFLREIGRSLADNHRWAGLLLPGQTGTTYGTLAVRTRIARLLENAQRRGTLSPEVELGDVMAMVWGMRGLIEVCGDVAPDAWQRYLDLHLAALRGPLPLNTCPPISAAQLQQLPVGRHLHGSH